MKGNLGSEWEVLPSEGPGDGEPRRSTMKYMALRGRVQRREKEKSSRRGGCPGRGMLPGSGRAGCGERAEGGGIPRIQVIQRLAARRAGSAGSIMIQLPAVARSREFSEGAAGGLVGAQSREPRSGVL